MKAEDRIGETKSRPIERLIGPFQQFVHTEASGGLLLLGCTVIALVWANSAWADSYESLWETYLARSRCG
jgi:NhaA family Na+:H+ antiporter